jgi:15-cis-phytoene synthase
VLREGYARARAVTRAHAKSFYFASVALFGARRKAAFALYAFCRRLDDLVDGDDAGPTAALAERLTLARDAVRSLYATGEAQAARALPLHPAELAAFADTVRRYGIPEEPFQELLSGLEMDLTRTRYQSFEELKLYCHRVAGVVGLMMTPVLGLRDARALPYAADLGIAMQLTNILRDVREDLGRGRLYLPADELAAFGVTEAQLREGRVDDRFRTFMKFQVARARAFEARAQLGIPDITGFGSQSVVRLMGTLYGGILSAIEARDYDVFGARAHVPLSGKLRLAARVLLLPQPALPALPAEIPMLPCPAPDEAARAPRPMAGEFAASGAAGKPVPHGGLS